MPAFWIPHASDGLKLRILSRPQINKHIIEGFRAKRAYIGFWPIFIFLQDRANFSQTDLFWHETHRSVIALVDLPFVLQK